MDRSPARPRSGAIAAGVVLAAVSLAVSLAVVPPATATTQKTPKLKSLVVKPASIPVGAAAYATVTLKRAPKKDVLVDIASSDEWIALPFSDTITVPAGQNTGVVLVYGLHQGSVTITATLRGVTKSSPLTIA